LREDDDLMIVVPRAVRELTEQRLRAVSRSGRLARFYGDRGDK
jgi:cell volume regulation protein A